jgi:regulator of protease activity HflC (stomatin/prohibitin superfamily)
MTNYTLYIVLAFVLLFLSNAIRILREYERGVIFTLGRFWKVKGPGFIILIPFVQQMVRVDLRTIVMDVPSQDVISRDNVSVKVNAVVYFRVVEPDKAIIQVENFYMATSQLAQTTLRSVLGQHELDEMLSERERLNADAEGEMQAAEKLLEAARTLSKQSQALQLRYLQTLTEIAGERTNTIVFPLPMDLIETLLNRTKDT